MALFLHRCRDLKYCHYKLSVIVRRAITQVLFMNMPIIVNP
jgi:hypothetical protein